MAAPKRIIRTRFKVQSIDHSRQPRARKLARQRKQDRLAKWRLIAAGLFIMAGAGMLHAQGVESSSLPDAPQPQMIVTTGSAITSVPKHHNLAMRAAIAQTTTLDGYLSSLDMSLRTMDMKTTHDLLGNSCHCFHEVDPIAPHTANYAAQASFQYGMAAAVTFAGLELRKHNHPRWARVVMLADIADEGYAVGHNLSLAPKPLPAVPVVAPVVPVTTLHQ